MDKEEMKKFLELSEPILLSKIAPMIAPRAKLIYLIGLIILAISVLGSLMTLLTGGFSAGLLSLISIFVVAVLFRMLCEFLLTYGK